MGEFTKLYTYCLLAVAITSHPQAQWQSVSTHFLLTGLQWLEVSSWRLGSAVG